MGQNDVSDVELSKLSKEEAAALADTEDEASLKAAAGEDEEDDAKAAAAKKAEEDAAAAKAAEDKARAELEEKAKAAKEAAEKAAKEAEAAKDDQAKQAAAKKATEDAAAAEAAAADARKSAEEKAAEAKAAAEKKAADEAAAAAAAAKPAPDDDDAPPFTPRYVAQPVEDFDKKMTALNERTTAALAKFKDGSITIEDYNAERDTVEKERAELREANLKATIAAEQAVQTGEQRWQWEIERFFRRVFRTEGIDYADSRRLNGALDTEVKRLAGLKENEDKNSQWFLEEAHKNVKASLNLTSKAGAGDKAAAEAAAAAAEAKRKADEAATAAALKGRKVDKAKLAPDVGGAAKAGDEDTGGGEFAALDKLEGMELEAALARLTPDQQARYLAGA